MALALMYVAIQKLPLKTTGEGLCWGGYILAENLSVSEISFTSPAVQGVICDFYLPVILNRRVNLILDVCGTFSAK